MKKTIITAFAAMLLCIPSFSTETTSSDEAKESKKKKEVTYNEKGEIIKTGLNFGPLPVVAFDADRGFQYGALLNIYNFDFIVPVYRKLEGLFHMLNKILAIWIFFCTMWFIFF